MNHYIVILTPKKCLFCILEIKFVFGLNLSVSALHVHCSPTLGGQRINTVNMSKYIRSDSRNSREGNTAHLRSQKVLHFNENTHNIHNENTQKL